MAAPLVTLALDTSTSQGGAAVLTDGQVLSRHVWIRGKSHSEMLTLTLENCVREAGLQLSQLQRLAVGCGPGSFTGIRIAINATRTLAYALSLPVFSFDTTEILAAGVQPGAHPLLVLVNAHKNLLYTSRFEPQNGRWHRTHDPAALTLEEIESLVTTPHLCVGDGYREFESLLTKNLANRLIRDPAFPDFPQPEVLGTMPDTWPSARPLVWNEVQALYIRASEAEEKLRAGT